MIKNLTKRSLIRAFGISLTLVIFLGACTKEKETTPENPYSISFVSESEAIEIASLFEFPKDFTNESSTLKSDKTALAKNSKQVKTINAVLDGCDSPALYIINYEGGGFLVLSADKRHEPILAFSETNIFPLDSKISGTAENYIEGWINASVDNIYEIREANLEQAPEVSKAWEPSTLQKIACPGGDGDTGGTPNTGCVSTSELVGPLMQTQWGQDVGYNNLCMPKGCTAPYNGRALTGCVATAMGQIIRYHRFPNTYNYNSMPNISPYYSPSLDVCQLLSDVAYAVSTNWGCYPEGSGASTDAVMPAFVNVFGYSQAQLYTNYINNSSTVSVLKSNIRALRPVLLRGQANSSSSGHMWVCDGFSSRRQCMLVSGGYIMVETLYLHMNWGKDGMYDGWFAYNNFNCNGTSYNQNIKMITVQK